jgi:hypothetical protein
MSEGVALGGFLGKGYSTAPKKEVEIDTKRPISKGEARVRGALQEASFGWSDELEATLYTLADPGTSYSDYKKATRLIDKMARDQQGDAYEEGEYGAMIATALPLISSGVGLIKFIPKLAKVLSSKLGIKGTIKAAGEISKKGLKTGKMGKANRAMSDEARKILKKESQGKLDVVGRKRLKEQAEEVVKKNRLVSEAKAIKGEVVGAAKIGAGMGGFYGLGKSERENIYGQVEDALVGAGKGALLSAVFPVGKMMFKKGTQLNTAIKHYLTGLTQEQIEWLQKHPSLFLKNDTFEGFKSKISNRVEQLQKVSDKAVNQANKSLDRAKTITKDEVLKKVDDVIERETERKLAGGIPTGQTEEYLKKLKAEREELIAKFGKNDMISQAELNAYRKNKNNEAFKYNDPKSATPQEELAASIKQMTHGFDEIISGQNTTYDKLMAPARQIQSLLGGDQRKGKVGFRKYYNMKQQPNSPRHNFIEGVGPDSADRRFVNSLSAPFRDRGMEKFKAGRNLIDELENLHQQYVGKSKKGEQLLRGGEAVALKHATEQAGPKTGYSAMFKEPVVEATKKLTEKIPMGKFMAQVLGTGAAALRTEKGKDIGAQVIARQALKKEGKPGKLKALTERLSDPIGLPRLGTSELIGREGESIDEARKRVEHVLRRKEKEALPGKEFGIKTPFNQGIFEQVKPEDEEMEKKKQEFLRQQQGLKKAKF